jgi:D-tyrosyl-tRNA(Tyr) deacylase
MRDEAGKAKQKRHGIAAPNWSLIANRLPSRIPGVTMRVLIQRVSQASVRVQQEVVGQIGPGLLVLVGIEGADSEEDLDWLAAKVVAMRIFADDEGKMNRDVREIGGGILVVSQFTLHASTKKGNRPSFIRAARPELAELLFEKFKAKLSAQLGQTVASGQFGAEMAVELVNDGPVTIGMDSRARE